MADNKRQILKFMRTGDAGGFARAREELGEDFPALNGETFRQLQLLGGFDLSGLDLSNTEWEECLLDGARFTRTDLSGAYFHGSTLLNCGFEETTLEGAAIEGCVLRHTTVSGAQLGGSEVSDSQFADCTLRGLSFDDDDWSSLTFNNSTLTEITGSATLSGWTVRDSETEGFDTSDMQVERCTILGLAEDASPPAGFVARAGRRRRLS